MAKIEVGRFSELMRRFLSMSGVVEVTQELAPEISAAFILEGERPEWEYIKGQKLCSSQATVTPAVGLPATHRIRNPLGSGVVAIIEQVNASVTGGDAAVLVSRFETNLNLATVVPIITRDTRWPIRSSALIGSMANVGIAVGADFIWNGYTFDLNTLQIKLPFVLTPGFALDVTQETVNINFRADFHWLERRLGELEVA